VEIICREVGHLVKCGSSAMVNGNGMRNFCYSMALVVWKRLYQIWLLGC